jgi:hypothetical protein
VYVGWCYDSTLLTDLVLSTGGGHFVSTDLQLNTETALMLS